jgi:hypothetical protein
MGGQAALVLPPKAKKITPTNTNTAKAFLFISASCPQYAGIKAFYAASNTGKIRFFNPPAPSSRSRWPAAAATSRCVSEGNIEKERKEGGYRETTYKGMPPALPRRKHSGLKEGETSPFAGEWIPCRGQREKGEGSTPIGSRTLHENALMFFLREGCEGAWNEVAHCPRLWGATNLTLPSPPSSARSNNRNSKPNRMKRRFISGTALLTACEEIWLKGLGDEKPANLNRRRIREDMSPDEKR